MNQLTSLGVILLFALTAGHVVKWLRIPEVTGYLLAGVALGPAAMGWITPDNLSALELLSDVALGLILFSIGTIFEFERFRRIAGYLSRMVFWEAVITAALVTAGLLVAGQGWEISVLLGAMAIETAAASTLMVLREYNAQGPVTELLTGIFAVDNLLCLILTSGVMVAIRISAGEHATLYEAIFPLIWQLVGSVAVGYVIGFLLSMWSPKVVEHGERLILLAGCVLLGVGASNALGLSSLVTNLALGATMVNLSRHSKALFVALSGTDPPLYAIFFVLAGAELDVRLLASIGVVGAVYVLARICGKFAGISIGGRVPGVREHTKHLRFAVYAQAGLAVGLLLVINRTLPAIAPRVTAIVLSAVILFEIVGPLAVRWTLVRCGETRPETGERGGLLE